jgi:hypothetical protein
LHEKHSLHEKLVKTNLKTRTTRPFTATKSATSPQLPAGLSDADNLAEALILRFITPFNAIQTGAYPPHIVYPYKFLAVKQLPCPQDTRARVALHSQCKELIRADLITEYRQPDHMLQGISGSSSQCVLKVISAFSTSPSTKSF